MKVTEALQVDTCGQHPEGEQVVEDFDFDLSTSSALAALARFEGSVCESLLRLFFSFLFLFSGVTNHPNNPNHLIVPYVLHYVRFYFL